MSDEASTDGSTGDTGLPGLVLLARFHGLAVESKQLKHLFGSPGQPFAVPEMLRAARALGLKAREVQSTRARLVTTPMPALAALHDGSFVVIGAVGEGQVLRSASTAVISRSSTRRSHDAVRISTPPANRSRSCAARCR